MFRLLWAALSLLLIQKANAEFVVSCRSNVDCPLSMFCDVTMGKPPSCTPCIDCRYYHRHSGDVACVSFVLADCGPCFYGYKDTHHYDPSRRIEKCNRDYNIKNESLDLQSWIYLILFMIIFAIFI